MRKVFVITFRYDETWREYLVYSEEKTLTNAITDCIQAEQNRLKVYQLNFTLLEMNIKIVNR